MHCLGDKMNEMDRAREKFRTIMVQAEAEAQVLQLLQRCFASEFQQDGGT